MFDNLLTTKDIILPSGKEATVREMTGVEEDIFTNENLMKSGQAISKVLSNITKSLDGHKANEEDVDRLLSVDRNSLLINSRILSYGPKVISLHECQNTDCKNKFTVEIDLEELDFTAIDDVKALTYSVDIDEKVKATLKPMTGIDEKRLAMLSRTEDMLSLSLFARLSELIIEGKSYKDKALKDIIKKLPAKYRNHLRNILTEESKYGYDTLRKVDCPTCNTENTFDVMSLAGFFFPQTNQVT